MGITTQQFVLPGFGGDPSQDLTALTQKMYMRNFQRERLALAAEGKREQAGEFLKNYLNPKDYLSGTAYDPVIVNKINDAMQYGAGLAQQGADIPTLLTSLAPKISDINGYTTKAKMINQQIEDTTKRLKDTGAKGYNYDLIADAARRRAFHNFDDKGNDLGLMDINKVDPSQNYVINELRARPDQYTNAADFDEFAKSSPQLKNVIDAQRYDPRTGEENRRKMTMTGQNWLEPDYDQKTGKLKELVPRYDHATDNGNIIYHDVADENGQVTQQPVRLLDRAVYDNLTQQKGVGDYLRGQVMRHLQEYEDQTGKHIDIGSPQADMIARAIAYNELNLRKSGGIQEADIINKPSATQVRLSLLGSPYEQAKARREGVLDADKEYNIPLPGTSKKDKPLDAAGITMELFKNNPDYLTGPTEQDVKVNGTKRDLVNVTNEYPGGLLRQKGGQMGNYSNVYYDPKQRSLITEESDGQMKEFKEKELPTLMKTLSGPNRMDASKIDQRFADQGYKNGLFGQTYSSGPLLSRIEDENTQRFHDRTARGLDNVVKKGSPGDLKGLETPMGTITDAGNSWVPGKNYFITFKSPDGKTNVQRYNTREEMEKDIGVSTPPPDKPKPAAPTPSAAPATPAKPTKKAKSADNI